jgi:hypothetical protein
MRGTNPRDYPLSPAKDAARELGLRARRFVNDRANAAEVDDAIRAWHEATGQDTLRTENERLRAALERVDAISTSSRRVVDNATAWVEICDIARRALGEEPDHG